MKERICSFGSKFFSLRADPFQSVCLAGSKMKVTKVVLIVNIVENTEGCSFTFTLNMKILIKYKTEGENIGV